MQLPLIRVTCAIIISGGRVFAARRGPGASQPLRWEFPGGKVEAGETDEQCLLRELNEELSMQVAILRKLPPFYHNYPGFRIELVPFVCHPASTGHVPAEHLQTGWFTPGRLKRLTWAAADVPVMQYVTAHFRRAVSSWPDPSPRERGTL